jgi:hypothetical protein
LLRLVSDKMLAVLITLLAAAAADKVDKQPAPVLVVMAVALVVDTTLLRQVEVQTRVVVAVVVATPLAVLVFLAALAVQAL